MTIKGATISECGDYRYDLWRTWDKEKPFVTFIMLNPSTADANEDDATIRRCVGYAKKWGYSGLVVVNLFAYRATKRKVMLAHQEPVGLDNEEYIFNACLRARIVICAWGADGSHRGRSKVVADKLRQWGITPHYLSLTSKGEPGHPLYLKADLKPIPWV